MFRIILFAVFSVIGNITMLKSQVTGVKQNSVAGNTYAVVIGISSYKNLPDNKQLKFANRDADEFAKYLQSKAGGLVPEKNIRLLLDEEATTAAIYDALDWLLETCNKNDQVYFYFSGHGDVENKTFYKLGFLLAHNTPPHNYFNNAVRIEDLNNISDTLSRKAKVILITDACHSGDLAGKKFRGTFLVGEQLRDALKNGIRITSCGKDELSAENEQWGGGRSVFSYYLTYGLKGLADSDKDGIVTKKEIEKYLDTSFKNDDILKLNKHIQNPVIKGEPGYLLAQVDPAELETARKQFTGEAPQQRQESANDDDLPPFELFFKSLRRFRIDSDIDFFALDKLPQDSIPFSFIKNISGPAKSVMSEKQHNQLLQDLKDDPAELRRFKKELVVFLSNKGEEIINQYLMGDEAELERRRYYHANNNVYDKYTSLFSVALKLSEEDDFNHRNLEISKHYFTGLNARLKIAVSDKKLQTALIELAMAEQKKAMELDPNAAYVNNELGILYKLLGKYDLAGQHLIRATEIAGEWAIPWSNLTGLYNNTKNFQKGIEAAAKAKELRPRYYEAYANSGFLFEHKGNFLLAEEEYRQSVKLNSQHYFPFERLGYVYKRTAQYSLADSFYNEAAKRKKGFNLEKIDPNDGEEFGSGNPPILASPPCLLLLPGDYSGNNITWHFVMGLKALSVLPETAEYYFRKIIEQEQAHPLAWYYLGKALYEQQHWQEAEIVLKKAIIYNLNGELFEKYGDSLSKTWKDIDPIYLECIAQNFWNSNYSVVAVRYLLGAVYESWKHYAEAEAQFRAIIAEEPVQAATYYKLWRLLEKAGKHRDAEQVFQSYSAVNKISAQNELYAFYKRLIDKYPETAEWYYKAGKLLYDIAAADKNGYPNDRKYIDYEKGEEVFVQATMDEENGGHQEYFQINGETIYYADKIEYPRTEGIDMLKKAAALLTDDLELADVHAKIGDLYTWQGLIEKAPPYYKAAMDKKPDDAGIRIKLAKTAAPSYLFKDALEQLDTLHDRKQLNLEQQLLLIKYTVHSGNFSKADELLKESEKMNPYAVNEINELSGLAKMLAGKPKEAIPFYSKLMTAKPGDSIVQYILARLYALAGDKTNSWKWLEQALKNGFRYSNVLKLDETWTEFRKNRKWNSLLKKFPMKEYKTPEQNSPPG